MRPFLNGLVRHTAKGGGRHSEGRVRQELVGLHPRREELETEAAADGGEFPEIGRKFGWQFGCFGEKTFETGGLQEDQVPGGSGARVAIHMGNAAG